MNYLKSLKNLVIGDDSAEKIAAILPVSEKPFSCDPKECENGYKESCFDLRGDAATAPLYESAKAPQLHFLVSTGKTDWEHDAFEANGTLLPTFNSNVDKFSKNFGLVTKCNVTNESLNFEDAECLSLNKLDLLIMPWFVWIKGITDANIDKVFTEIGKLVQNKDSESTKGDEAEILIKTLNGVDGVKVIKDVNSSIILLCSHRTRDKKCGITAPIMKKEFDSQLRDLELYRDQGDDRPNGVKVTFVNHVGGHKFAANVLIYNKHGEFVWFARCTPLNVKFIINETLLHHKVYPENIRACSRFDAVKW